MMRINLIPDKDRASLQAIQLGTILFAVSVVLVAMLAFATVYLRWQVVSERERHASYQTTMTTLAKYRSETSRMQGEVRQLEELLKPLTGQLALNKPAIDITMLLNRTAGGAQTAHVWLKELSMQKDGTTPISGYAVEFGEVSKFLKAVGRDPLNVVMGSTRWVERGGVKLIEFSARVGPAVGGGQP